MAQAEAENRDTGGDREKSACTQTQNPFIHPLFTYLFKLICPAFDHFRMRWDAIGFIRSHYSTVKTGFSSDFLLPLKGRNEKRELSFMAFRQTVWKQNTHAVKKNWKKPKNQIQRREKNPNEKGLITNFSQQTGNLPSHKFWY